MHIISGSLKNQSILTPKGCSTRPTSSRLRESLFNICQGHIEGARFMDLFAGSGAIGLEALSRGAASCDFVDSDRHSVDCIKKNLRNLHLEANGKIYPGSVFSWLEKLSKQEKVYDIIFADPPYDAKLHEIPYSQRVLEFVDSHCILSPGGTLFIEDSSAFKPNPIALKTLELTNIRRSGRSTLLQFRYGIFDKLNF